MNDLEQSAARGRALHVDTPSGVAGDMFLAAMIGLGVPEVVIRKGLAQLPLAGYTLELGTIERSGITARRLRIHASADQPERSYREIAAMLARADLAPGATRIAQSIFQTLAIAEARVHGVTPDEVHFHEVGAVDSIVDIVGAAIAIEYLEPSEITCSPLPLGRGSVRTRHGILPLPAPATVECLRGIPTYDAGIEGELVTPTGAAIVASVCTRFVPWPSFAPDRTGWGAGSREIADRANVVRVILGDASLAASELVVIEANVDDSTPEIVAYALERLAREGALDAWSQPIGMKKGRPAWMIGALARPPDAERLARVLMAETSSLGARLTPARRLERKRRVVRVATRFGEIAVKIADGDGLPANYAPEHEDCREAASKHRCTLREVYSAALRAATEHHG